MAASSEDRDPELVDIDELARIEHIHAPRRRRRGAWAIVAALLVLVVVGIVAMWVIGRS